jgi:hypothetical protein
MSKCRIIGAGSAGSTVYNCNVNLNTAGGTKKQGSPFSLDSARATRPVMKYAQGPNKNVIFTLNQLGNKGRLGRHSFADGVHKRAPYDYNKPRAQPAGCPTVTLTDIATYQFDGEGIQVYVLNADTTILPCQTLVIDSDIFLALLVPTGLTLTNNGTIRFLNGVLVAVDGGSITNNGALILTNTTFIAQFSSSFANTGTVDVRGNSNFGIGFGSFFTNQGTVTGESTVLFSILSSSFVNNGPFTTRGMFETLNADTPFTNNSTFDNYGEMYNNSSSFINTGTLTNFSFFRNLGTFYNVQGGNFVNYDVFDNQGTLNSPTVDAGCGVGYLTSAVADGTACP